MGEWVRGWAHEALHAGLPGKGADVAWWELALKLEENECEGHNVRLAAFDLTKAFDKVHL